MENRSRRHPQQPNDQAEEASTGPQSSMPQSPLLSGASSLISLTQTEEFFDLIASSQSRRLDDQRASIGDRLGIRIAQNNVGHLCEACSPREPSDEFFNMLIKYQVSPLNVILLKGGISMSNVSSPLSLSVLQNQRPEMLFTASTRPR